MASLGDDLLKVVNKLQDLVFNTIGNDSLDLPQIVRVKEPCTNINSAFDSDSYDLGRSRLPVFREIVRVGEHRGQGLSPARKWYRYTTATDLAAHQHPQ